MSRVVAMTIVVAIAVASCSQAPSSKPPTATSSAIPCPQAQKAPTFAASSPSSRNLELVWLKGSQIYVVRDITDILNVTSVSKFENTGLGWRFASANDLSYFDDSRVVRMPLGGSPRTAVACVAASALAWSPDGTAAAYVTRTDSAGKSELHMVSGGQNRLADSLTGNSLTDCVAYDCNERISVDLSYSPDGAYLSYIQSWGGPVFRLWTADGKLVKSLDGTGKVPGQPTYPSMSVWSGGKLYWRDDKGVEVWHDGQQSLLLPGVQWIGPHASPGAALIAYMTRDNAHVAHVGLLNTSTAQTRELKSWRSWPAFLNSHLVWYREERPCVAADPAPCPASSAIPSGKTYIYDLLDDTETESVIQSVFDVWPHAG